MSSRDVFSCDNEALPAGRQGSFRDRFVDSARASYNDTKVIKLKLIMTILTAADFIVN